MLSRPELATSTRRGFDVRATIAVALIALLALVRVDRWLLEADQARFYFEAWAAAVGEQSTVSYLERTSWLYVTVLSVALRLGVSIASLPLLSSLLGAVAFVAIFLALRQMNARRNPIALAILYASVPGLALVSLNGYPTILALAFLLGFVVASPDRRSMTLGAVSLALALLLKADIILTFPGVVLWKAAQTSGLPTRERVRLTGTWIGAMVASLVPLVIVQLSVGRSTEYASSWTDSFPFTFDAVTHAGNWANLAGPGIGTLVLAGLAALLAMWRRDGDGMKWLAAVVWIAVPVVFWGLIVGNSTRHLVPAIAPLVWAAGTAFRGRGVMLTLLFLGGAVGLNLYPDPLVSDETPVDGNTWQAARDIETGVVKTRDNTSEALAAFAGASTVNFIDAADREYAIFEFLVQNPDARIVDQRTQAYGNEEYMVRTTFAAPDEQIVHFWYVARGDINFFIDVMAERGTSATATAPNSVWTTGGTFHAVQLDALMAEE